MSCVATGTGNMSGVNPDSGIRYTVKFEALQEYVAWWL